MIFEEASGGYRRFLPLLISPKFPCKKKMIFEE
jgi:hypothetical protein